MDIALEAKALNKGNVRANHLFDDNWIFVNCVLYVVLGAMVMVLPQHLDVNAEMSGRSCQWSYLSGPLMGIMRAYPDYLRANQALSEIEALEMAKLDSIVREDAAEERMEPAWQGPLTSIEAHDIQYRHPGDKNGEGFHIGPLSLTITGGQIVFIVGGNGSGKSTLIKTLTGLYAPTGGTLHVNGVLVRPNTAAYRELSSVIYPDFHLFTKLYGLLDVEEAEVHRLLTEMQLASKTAFRSKAFTKRDLSTGQRKRLAMIVALLEDRTLYVLDEWAAD